MSDTSDKHTLNDVVIVGGGLAGAKAAIELRNRGYERRIFLLGAEPELPYERPPLSKDLLRGESDRAAAQVNDLDRWRDLEVELLLGSPVAQIDTERGRVAFADAVELRYDALLIATGARPRPLRVPGATLGGLHYLRTVADAEALRGQLKEGVKLVVVGAGWIGSEVAASARQLGAEVTVIDPLELPNVRVFGAEIGEFYRDLHAKHGVKFMLGEEVASFAGSKSVQQVTTKSGHSVDCELAVIAVGVAPNVEVAQPAGVKTDNGIIVDERLRASQPGVWAAGDVASVYYSFYERHIRLEHWSAALEQGPAAARSMLGDTSPYDVLPYFYSDQYDVGMEFSGQPGKDDDIVFRGERDSGEFVAFWLDGDRVTAGMNVNVWDVNDAIQKLIRSRQPIDRAKLTDPDVELATLVRPRSARRWVTAGQ